MDGTTIMSGISIDPKLVAFIQRHGGSVTVRQLSRGLASCRRAYHAHDQLDALVTGGLGCWTYNQPTVKGGRPKQVFNLTAVPGHLASLIPAEPEPATVHDSRSTRRIAHEIVQFLNRYDRLSTSQLSDALKQVQRILSDLTEHEITDSRFQRSMQVNSKGVLRVRWELRGPQSANQRGAD